VCGGGGVILLLMYPDKFRVALSTMSPKLFAGHSHSESAELATCNAGCRRCLIQA
jgi:hypothetical protein